MIERRDHSLILLAIVSDAPIPARPRQTKKPMLFRMNPAIMVHNATQIVPIVYMALPPAITLARPATKAKQPYSQNDI